MPDPPRALAVRKTELDRRRPAAGGRLGLQRWADRISLGPGGLSLAGVALAVLGGLGASLNPLGLFGVVLCGGMLTAGGGLVFLGLDKARRARKTPAAPSASELAVLQERGRRIHTTMAAAGGDWTFDLLRARMGWTDEALVSALLHMRDEGQIIEDLNLDTGKWVYRLQDPDLRPGSSASLTLDDRARRQLPGETP